MVAGARSRAAEADRVALPEQRFLAPEPDLARAAVDHHERTVRRLVGDDEVAVAAEDTRVQARGMLARHDDAVALLATDVDAFARLEGEGLVAVAERQHPLRRLHQLLLRQVD